MSDLSFCGAKIGTNVAPASRYDISDEAVKARDTCKECVVTARWMTRKTENVDV